MCKSLSSTSIHEPRTFQDTQPLEQAQRPRSNTWDGRGVALTQPPRIGDSPLREPSLRQSQPLDQRQVDRQPPPLTLGTQARHATLPDRATMIDRCGRPKDNALFGLIKMSTNYKAVLGQLDQVRAALDRPQGHATLGDQLARVGNTLAQLEQAVDTYIAGSDKQRFKAEMRELKTQIASERASLGRLQEQADSNRWPEGISLKEAMDYDREGIALGDVAFFKEVGLKPADARQALSDGLSREQIHAKYYPEKVIQDARELRAELRQLDRLSDDHLPRLVNQAEFALKKYVELFREDGKIPVDMQALGRAQLENQFDQLPLATLGTPEKRELASRLLDLINENTSLIHLKYQDFDPRFAMPESATREFGHTEGRTADSKAKTLPENRDKAFGFLEKTLDQLIPASRIKTLTPESLIAHFEGLLRDRLDARIAFGLLRATQTGTLLENMVKRFDAFTQDQQKELIETKLPALIEKYQPDGSSLQLGNKLGEGAFGKVYEGTFNGRPVVVKEVQTGTGLNYADLIVESLRQSELRENPYAPRILGFKATGLDTATIVMDKVGGGDYDKLFRKVNTEQVMGTKFGTDSQEKLANRAKLSVHCLSGMIVTIQPWRAVAWAASPGR